MRNKVYLKFLFILLISASIIWIITWRNPGVNHSGETSIHNCIYNASYETIELKSMGRVLNSTYVRNASANCIAPYFPAIHITASGKHNAWLHIARADSSIPELQQFIDSHETTYPFYTLEQDFYDSPLWEYGFFSKPLTYWRGRAYAVNIDRKNKTIKCIGGVEWGFKLSYFSLRPQMITPSPLISKDWEKDWLIFKKGFKEDITLITR